MISTLSDRSVAAALRAAVARSRRCSIPVKRPSVRAAADEAELTGTAADVEDAGAGHGNEESCGLGGDARRESTGEARAFESGPGRFGRISCLRWTSGPGLRIHLPFAAFSGVKQAGMQGKERNRLWRDKRERQDLQSANTTATDAVGFCCPSWAGSVGYG